MADEFLPKVARDRGWDQVLAAWVLAPQPRLLTGPGLFWLTLTLASAVLWAAIAVGRWSGEFVVPDDGRQHLFWMSRYLDPGLFPGDRIADYFQSVAPLGFRTLYGAAAALGIEPLTVARWLPLILGPMATGLCFVLSFDLFPVPAAAFGAALLFAQNLWMRDDLASGTARAFLNPLFLLILIAYGRRSRFLIVGAIALLGWFYPHYVLVTAAIAVLEAIAHLWNSRKNGKFCEIRKNLGFSIWVLAACVVVLIPFALDSSAFGPTIGADLARTLPEFLPDGRSRFFYDDFGRFWLSGGRSGVQIPLEPPLMALGLLWPILLWGRWRDRLPTLALWRSRGGLLSKLVGACFLCFGAAHGLLFRLHLPSRYTQHGLRIAIAIAAAATLWTLATAAAQHLKRATWLGVRGRAAIGAALTVVFILGLTLEPLTSSKFPKTSYVTGTAPDLYGFLQGQPPDVLIASLSGEANNIPTFARRSVLVGAEAAIPYHWGYYREFRDRVLALIDAQYAPDLRPVAQVIRTYGVDLWLLDRGGLTAAYLEADDWLRQYQPAFETARSRLTAGEIPALAAWIEPCQVFASDRHVVLSAACLLAAADQAS
jgi:hypothetical protein